MTKKRAGGFGGDEGIEVEIETETEFEVEDLDDLEGSLASAGVGYAEEDFDDESGRTFGALSDGETLKRGDLFRSYPNGPLYRVRMVNKSRAYCTLVPEKGDRILKAADEINISPCAGVVRVSSTSIRTSTPAKEQSMTAAAGIPVASKSTREREKERKAGRAATKTPAAKLVGAAAASKAKARITNKTPKTVRQCACACGEETMGYFVPGHDARFKSWMVKIERGTMTVAELPKAVQKAFEFKKRGPGFVTTLNYKGEKHNGYDKPKA